jgi:fructose-specific component phosphotransferase system IIB-like protein
LEEHDMTQSKRKRHKKILTAIAAMAVLTTLYVIYSAVDIWQYSTVDEMTHADAAIVLGAGIMTNQHRFFGKESIMEYGCTKMALLKK